MRQVESLEDAGTCWCQLSLGIWLVRRVPSASPPRDESSVSHVFFLVSVFWSNTMHGTYFRRLQLSTLQGTPSSRQFVHEEGECKTTSHRTLRFRQPVHACQARRFASLVGLNGTVDSCSVLILRAADILFPCVIQGSLVQASGQGLEG